MVGLIAGDMDLLARCSLAAHFLWLDEGGRVWTKGKCGCCVEVPPIGSRLLIVQWAHAMSGYADGRRLLELLRS